MAQYEVNNSSIQTLLSWIRSGEMQFRKFNVLLCGIPPRCVI